MPQLYTIGVKTDLLKEQVLHCAILSHPHAITLRLKECGYNGFFILSTCNRFEVYSAFDNVRELYAVILENHTEVKAAIEAIGYELKGEDALLHLFRVTAGLESNLLGDYEIAGQVKAAVKVSKEAGCLNGGLERIINAAQSASKDVKATTSICRGKISYASAAVEMALEKLSGLNNVPVLIYGLGKIGRSLLDYLVKQTDANNITLCNRHSKHIQDCLEQYNVSFLHRDELDEALKNYPVVFVCTGSDSYTLTTQQLSNSANHLIFDLAFPANVQPQVADIEGVSLYAMAELESVFAETIAQRKTEVPVAEQILQKHLMQYKADVYRRNQYLLDLPTVRQAQPVQQPVDIAI